MSGHPTRRDIAKAAGAAALGMAAPAAGLAQTPADNRPQSAPGIAARFPDGFCWGVATSAFQIEGAVKEDGRGASIWDVYAHTPGKIKGGDNADIANDHYHRYRDDVRLMQDIGVKAYRFSIAWPRIFPSGAGQPNARGLAFYDRLIDALLEAGIEPFPTLYHWDLPQALQDKGGWQSRDTAEMLDEFEPLIRNLLTPAQFAELKLPEIRARQQAAQERNKGFKSYLASHDIVTTREAIHFADARRLPSLIEEQVNLLATQNLGICPLSERKFYIRENLSASETIELDQLKEAKKIHAGPPCMAAVTYGVNCCLKLS